MKNSFIYILVFSWSPGLLPMVKVKEKKGSNLSHKSKKPTFNYKCSSQILQLVTSLQLSLVCQEPAGSNCLSPTPTRFCWELKDTYYPASPHLHRTCRHFDA